ncbi:hypothetical protein [Acinetobacter populi]|uniref:hypothetical protein n=1 Tax=Acinetobacter populi TaxID=1582270 RepID=UPI00148BD33E|nr:hypothetical protein [Acinetobacter populi]
MSKCNNQSKQNRTHVIAVRVTEAERAIIEKVAYETRRKPTRVLLDAFIQQQQEADCTT